MPDLSLSPLAPVLSQLVPAWRARAEELRSWGAAGNADTLERAAAELESALRTIADGVLTLEQAADESGYSAEHLGRLVREGKIPNAGRRHSPAIRRADLPRKAGTLRPALADATSKAQIARAVATSYRRDRR